LAALSTPVNFPPTQADGAHQYGALGMDCAGGKYRIRPGTAALKDVRGATSWPRDCLVVEHSGPATQAGGPPCRRALAGASAYYRRSSTAWKRKVFLMTSTPTKAMATVTLFIKDSPHLDEVRWVDPIPLPIAG